MVLGFKALLLLLLISWGSVSASISRLGEFQTPLFYGSHLPEYEYNHYSFHFNFIESEMNSNYVERNINDEFISLSEYISNEFYQGVNCPDESYLEKNEYIRFLVRLQVISYLFQSLREHEYAMDQMNFKSSCDTDWIKMVQSCKPKTKEMAFFQESSLLAFKNLSPVKAAFKPKLQSFIKKWVKKVRRGNATTLTQVQLQNSCNNSRCTRLITKNIPKKVGAICQREKDLFLSLCSERDQLYGASRISEVYPLLISSNGLRGINKDKKAPGCVKRFIQQNKNLEREVPFLDDLFSILYDYNISNRSKNPQGRLFTIGAAKEFMDKGLKEVFKKQAQPPVKKKETKVVSRISNPEFKQIILPEFKKVKKKRLKRKQVPKAKATPTVRKTSFLISCEIRQESDLESIDIDMDKFKRDYVFTLSEKKKILPVVKRYSSVTALKSMKSLDKLGTKQAPMPLKFLKFLIDENLNQNLFNMNLVLGEKIYVINDIDKNIKTPNLIKLHFQISGNSGWQMSVLKD